MHQTNLIHPEGKASEELPSNKPLSVDATLAANPAWSNAPVVDQVLKYPIRLIPGAIICYSMDLRVRQEVPTGYHHVVCVAASMSGTFRIHRHTPFPETLQRR